MQTQADSEIGQRPLRRVDGDPRSAHREHPIAEAQLETRVTGSDPTN